MKNMKYSEILKANRDLEGTMDGEPHQIALLGNITVAQLKEILEYSLRSSGVNAHVTLGNYDNIVQDSAALSGHRLVIIFWEPANFIDGGQYRINLMSSGELEALEARIKNEFDLLVSHTRETSLILLNKFSSLIFSHTNIPVTALEALCQRLNAYLAEKAPVNMRLVDIEKIIAAVSIEKSVDFRDYYSSKMLYAVDFFKHYAQYIKPFALSDMGKAKKALILDCDNTIWKGIVGEDGHEGIEMSPRTKDGAIFKEVQSIALDLSRKGIILGLCSKNNPEDVEEVLRNHPDMTLREEDFTITKINWNDKVTNLRAIAKDLNIGIDSLVFVDDSPFEADFVKQSLPEITVFEAPRSLHQYPSMMRDMTTLFYNLSETAEDTQKKAMYKMQVLREQQKAQFGDLNDYLRSLDLKIHVHMDDEAYLPRIAQMTQKTNQFNLTTKRYTEGDIESMFRSHDWRILVFDATDKFGDYGITGLCMLEIEGGHTATIDTFLMSCRVIGRNLEFAFFDFIIDFLKRSGIKLMRASYIRTKKNSQVSTFYENLGFELAENRDESKTYELDLFRYEPRRIDSVEVTGGE